jgi:hypothetical protein
MTTRSTILSLAALATLSLAAFAPTQASAWGMRGGYGDGGYRSMGHFGSSYRPRVWASEPCLTEYAPPFRRHRAPRFNYAEELPCEPEAFETRGYAPGRYAPMRQAQGYAPAQQTQGYAPRQPKHGLEPHGQRDFAPQDREDSYEASELEARAPAQQANPDSGPAEYSSRELQR